MTRTSKDTIRVVIADDHAVVRKGLVQIIQETRDLLLAGEAENGNELLDLIRQVNPDVVVMDINMPEKSGWDVMLTLKQERPRQPVLILSVSPEEDYAIKFFRAGASGYLAKSSAPEQLVEAIRKLAGGGKFVTPGLAEQLVNHLEEDPDLPLHDALSPREFQVMCLIASGKTVSEIADELNVSLPTISTHRARLLEKMNMKTNAQLTRYAFENHLVT